MWPTFFASTCRLASPKMVGNWETYQQTLRQIGITRNTSHSHVPRHICKQLNGFISFLGLQSSPFSANARRNSHQFQPCITAFLDNREPMEKMRRFHWIRAGEKRIKKSFCARFSVYHFALCAGGLGIIIVIQDCRRVYNCCLRSSFNVATWKRFVSRTICHPLHGKMRVAVWHRHTLPQSCFFLPFWLHYSFRWIDIGLRPFNGAHASKVWHHFANHR